MGQQSAIVQSVSAAGSSDPSSLERAHAAMMADKTLQHVLPDAPKPKPPPDWLTGFLEGLAAIGPLLQVLIWGAVILAILLLVAFIVRELYGVRLGWKKGPGGRPGTIDWRPDRGKAQALLGDADALAAQGRYDEAVHILLLRGVEDITARRPRLIGPALTSRDIAALPELPAMARPAFALIAGIVERSFFGGRPVDETGWLQARRAYEELIFEAVWS